jgi:tRNA pseudouridine55 synthase
MGMTSHDVVGLVRRATGVKRVGHAGTLDPNATGVLLVCVGPATRLAELLADQGKQYRATLVLGATTDTEDAWGIVQSEDDASGITQADLEEAVARFVGDIEQVPPMVSAVHHEGQRLYELARKGITVERAPRRIRVDSIALRSFEPGPRASAVLDMATGKGAYVRTLCADIGAVLGVGGHMGALCRTAVGRFTVDMATPVDRLSEETARERLIAPADAIRHLPSVRLESDSDRNYILNGRSIPWGRDEYPAVAVLDGAGSLIALGTLGGGTLRPSRVFPPDQSRS